MFKRFISYFKPHIGYFIVDMIAALFVCGAGLLYPTLARKIINEYVPEGNIRLLVIASLVLLGLYALKALCNYIIGYLGHVFGVRVQADMRRDLFEKFERLPFSYYDTHKTGDLLSRLVSDLFDVAELSHHAPENIMLASLMLIGSFFILWDISPELTLIMFAFIPFIVLFTVLSRKKMRQNMRASRAQIAEINAHAENAITGIRETKSYCQQEHEVATFNRGNALFAKFRSGAMRSLGTYDAVMNFLCDMLYLTVIFLGGVFLLQEKINGGDFTAFILYISMFLDPIKRFVALFEQLQEGMSGFARFHEIMSLPDEEDNGTPLTEEVRGNLEFADVTFSYQNTDGEEATRVIENFNLTIKEGQSVALVGPSGAGKSTLCHLIPRFYNVDSGEILLDGKNIQEISLSSLRENIGLVSQTVFLFDGTIRENILYGKQDATEEEVVEAAKKAKIHDFIMSLELGYDTPVGERGVRLSGGQKQRVAIARVFLKNPKILILDEATSALDNVTEIQIQASLEELSRGRTVIMVAHRLSTIKNVETIVVIDTDGVKEMGTHDELMAKNGIYRELYETQFKHQ
ncbi:MAG: ABC transporter ATP-binding protein [Clostridia bacterium]|nr:ABC transporter ATP-binding protein [Clostridia bacterium]